MIAKTTLLVLAWTAMIGSVGMAQTSGALILPPGFTTTTPAESWSGLPFGASTPYRVQYFYWSPCFQSPNQLLIIRGISLRSRQGRTYQAKRLIPLEINLSSATGRFNQVDTTFSLNQAGNRVMALNTRVDLPAQSGSGDFNITFPFQMPFLYQTEDPGLVVELMVAAQPAGSYDLDLAVVTTEDHSLFGVTSTCPSFTTGKSLVLTGRWPTLAGGSLRVDLSEGPPRQGAKTWPLLAFLGLRRSGTWFGESLPLDLIKFGAPGCQILTSPLLVKTGETDTNGKASFFFGVPSDYRLVGMSLYTQVLMVDIFTNQLGVVLSNGVASRVTGPYPIGRLFANSITATTGSYQSGSAPVMMLHTD